MDNNFKNPIQNGADPFVLFYEGKYSMYCTTETTKELVGANDFSTDTEEGDGIYVYTSEDLKSWVKEGYALKRGDSMGEKWFWAPEVLAYRGRFYMVYASEEHIAIVRQHLNKAEESTKHECIGKYCSYTADEKFDVCPVCKTVQ